MKMIIVDTALKKRHEANNPVKVALVGAGYIGRGITLQIEKYLPGMRVVAISNRTISQAARSYTDAGIESFNTVDTVNQLEDSIANGQYAISENALLLCEADGNVRNQNFRDVLGRGQGLNIWLFILHAQRTR